MKYYCLHHTPLTARKEYLTKQFSLLNLDVEWVTGFLPEHISMPENHRFVNLQEYSLYLKHLHCFEDQVKNNIDLITVFEDDVIIPDNYNNLKLLFLKEFKEIDGDIMYEGSVGDYGKVRYPIEGKHVYYESYYLGRHAHCYTVTLEATKKFLSFYSTNFLTPDWNLNECITNFKLRSCWTVPHLDQGSCIGSYNSTIR